MTPDPRTEEIRARRAAALSAFDAPAEVSMAVAGPSGYGWGAVDAETGQTVVYSTVEEWAEMAIHAPADLAYLLDRDKALEDVAKAARELIALYAADDVTVDDVLDAEDDLAAALDALDGDR